MDLGGFVENALSGMADLLVAGLLAIMLPIFGLDEPPVVVASGKEAIVTALDQIRALRKERPEEYGDLDLGRLTAGEFMQETGDLYVVCFQYAEPPYWSFDIAVGKRGGSEVWIGRWSGVPANVPVNPACRKDWTGCGGQYVFYCPPGEDPDAG